VRASRRVLLLGSGAALASACTSSPPPSTPLPSSALEAAIFDLSFDIVSRSRPFELVAPGFAVVQTDDAQGSSVEGPAAPYAAVEVAVTSSGTRGSVSAGLATADGDHVLVRWAAGSGRVSLSVRSAGRTQVLRYATASLSGAFRLGFALCENQVTALVDTGDGWRPVLTERAKVAALVDLRREAVLAAYRYTWAVDDAEPAGMRAGLFGMTGLRDPHLVQEADGTPYEREGRYFITWTSAGLGFFHQAHWSVWSFAPDSPADQRLEAQLFSRRDGLVLGDHAGQLVRDGDDWLVATSSWGDFAPGSIHVRGTTTRDDLLTGVHLLDTEPVALPTPHGTWDPGLTEIDGRWHVSFVASPSQEPFDFHPALASTAAGAWTSGLTPVAAATSLHQCEGPLLVKVGGEHYLLASDKDNQCYPVFDLTGRRLGRLDAPYPTNIPHPQLVPDPAGGWWLLTFDDTQFAEDVMGYGGHGDVVLMHSGGA